MTSSYFDFASRQGKAESDLIEPDDSLVDTGMEVIEERFETTQELWARIIERWATK